MPLLRPFKSFLVLFARQMRGRVQKEVAAASGLTQDHLGDIERGETRDPSTDDVITALQCLELEPAEAVLLSSFLDALDQLDPLEAFGEAAAREEAAAAAAQQVRLRWGGAAQTGYPASFEVELDRQEARDAWQSLQPVETLEDMALVVGKGRDFQTWAMVELLCDESIRAASKDVRRAQDLALVAVLVAADLRVTDDWRLFLLGYAAAHLANAYRVICDFEEADWILETAKLLWNAGRDPEKLLDPGRLLDLEGSLRRAQRRFRQALAVLERAALVTRRPVQVALKQATTLEARGEYEQAIEILLAVTPLVEEHPKRRLLTIHRFNLATCLVHVGRHGEAAVLLPSIRQLVTELQDKEDSVRCRWLEGRIAAGLGNPEEALRALAEAHQEFLERDLHYDAALCIVESLALRLRLGHLAEVPRLAFELKPLLAEKSLQGRPLKALLILDRAVERREATAELTGRLLAVLFRARPASRL
jgi:tetratricopeptide (TPR) repeat protein